MNITIPEELAKRVLEVQERLARLHPDTTITLSFSPPRLLDLFDALALASDLAAVEHQTAIGLYGGYPANGLGRRVAAAERDLLLVNATRDELAALLIPKETT
jgi:hypothetical protein